MNDCTSSGSVPLTWADGFRHRHLLPLPLFLPLQQALPPWVVVDEDLELYVEACVYRPVARCYSVSTSVTSLA